MKVEDYEVNEPLTGFLNEFGPLMKLVTTYGHGDYFTFKDNYAVVQFKKSKKQYTLAGVTTTWEYVKLCKEILEAYTLVTYDHRNSKQCREMMLINYTNDFNEIIDKHNTLLAEQEYDRQFNLVIFKRSIENFI